jgi:predicted  nucleic acid-binding Zn-ribbon protein
MEIKGATMAACERHESMEKDIERIRDDIAQLYTRTSESGTNISALVERDKVREDSILKLESAMERGMSKLEGMIQALSAQVTALQTAPARKIESRYNDAVKQAIGWIIAAGLAFAAAKIFRIGP